MWLFTVYGKNKLSLSKFHMKFTANLELIELGRILYLLNLVTTRLYLVQT